MFNNILVAIDGSDHSRRATEMAAHMAERDGARLLLVHVVGNGKVPANLARMLEVEQLTGAERPPPPNVANVVGGISTVERGTDSREHEDQMKETVAEMLLAEAEKTARKAGVKDVVRVAKHGDPVHRILDTAARESADLIVMGSRGLSDLQGLLMGSVSHKICQLSKCSCVTVK